MTAPGPTGGPARHPALAERPGLLGRATGAIAAVLEPAIARVLGIPRIAMAHAVHRRFSAAGGPVLARGLAFVALFALVPALLVVLAIVGVLVTDPGRREEIAALVAEQLPPLEPVLDEALAGISGLAAPTGLVGAGILLWTASSFVRALDEAFRLVFGDAGAGRTLLRGLVAALVVAGGMLAIAIGLVFATLPGPIGDILGAPAPLVGGLASLATVTGLVALAYRFVPRPRPAWRAIGLPAAATGMAIQVLTVLFGLIGPLLFGSAHLYGAFGALLLGLVWLGTVTQSTLLGAAWVAERDRRRRAAVAPAVPADASGT